ncbi:hypothetical protein B0O80DRAFT_472951 [Mortierella sp. GBAus27b]|nr:hypothetical protein B0O80DRAFT_472951 [Mortierella sp. GBAus27b]
MRDLLLNLDALHLTRIQLPHYSKPPSGFPKMKNLTLRDLSDTPPLDQLEFILLCPNLRRLCWGATESGVLGETIQTYPIDQFAKALGENTWPELEYLKWPTRGNSDQELASIIGAIPRLTGFTLRRSMISEQAKKELRHHFGWLKELSLHQIRSTDRGFPVEALRYCPQLESFHARVIPINAFVDPEPWPCESSLKVLRIGLHRNTTMEGDLLQYDFIKRLSRLHRLEELSLSCYGRGDSRVGFNMEQGLDQLSTLTRLKTRVKIWSTHPVGTRGRLDGRSLEEPRGRRGAECPPW